VWRAYYNYRAAVRKLDFGEALLAASQEAYDANLKTYGVGLSTIVELLTAERDLATARTHWCKHAPSCSPRPRASPTPPAPCRSAH
jgi:outer membrane protein TolC